MTTWVYVDETKRAGYVVAAVSVSDPDAVRKVVRGLVLPGQRRIHMKHEQPRRRGAIVSALVTLPIEVTIYDAGRIYDTEVTARAACFRALVKDLTDVKGDVKLVIEQDDSLIRSDRHELYQLTREVGLIDSLEYRHQRAYDEPLLALPDVAAWCWVRSGEWRRRIEPTLSRIRRVEH